MFDVKADATEDKGTGWSHLVKHHQRAYDAPGRTDEELLRDRAAYTESLATADQDMRAYELGRREQTFAQINAKQARYTGWLKAIAEEQMRRRYG